MKKLFIRALGSLGCNNVMAEGVERVNYRADTLHVTIFLLKYANRYATCTLTFFITYVFIPRLIGNKTCVNL